MRKFGRIAFGLIITVTVFLLFTSQQSTGRNIQEVSINTVRSTTPVKGFIPASNTYEIVNLPQDGRTNVIKINGKECNNWNVLGYSLSGYRDKLIKIDFSIDIMRVGSAGRLHWVVNNLPDFTTVSYLHYAESGVWQRMYGRVFTTPNNREPLLYLSAWGNNSPTTIYYLDNIEINIQPINITIDTSLPALHTKWSFPVGVWLSGEELYPNSYERQLLKHFNVLCHMNFFKGDFLMPSPWTPNGAYRWTNADIFVNYAEENNRKIRGIDLFWHDQTPDEFFKGNNRDGLATIDELYSRMENHVKTMFQKYHGRIEWWSVVNEAVADNGGPRLGGNARHNSHYTQIMENAGKKGMDRYEWVLKAFQWARQYADMNNGQNVKLILNDYDIESPGVKLNEFLRLLDYLIANKAPIDGVGIQGHIAYDRANIRSDLNRTIDTISRKRNPITRKNLTVQISELDISLFKDSETWNNPSAQKTTVPENELNSRLTQQARLYRELFDMFEQKYREGKLEMVLISGVADINSWLNYEPINRINHPLLFDWYYQPKPAYYELIRGR
ncbi:MAG: endo-1,4-beta-xylanase [Treponema sp.]|nr:endo-1,4-beta-xylanase [Treponema sp.]